MFVSLFFGFAINLLTAETNGWWAPLRPLAAYPWIWVPASVAAWLLWRLWRRHRAAVTWAGNPYPGLAPFDADWAPVFFGRAAEVQKVRHRLERSGVAAARRVITLVGPSGSGKSSMLRAGVLPALPERWRVLGPMQPGPDVFLDLAVACETGTLAEHDQTARLLREEARAGGTPKLMLGLLAGRHKRIVLAIDQLEDLFVRSRPDDRGPFLDLLRAALNARQELHVVATMRPEFLATASILGDGLFTAPIPLAPLDPGQLREAIERPASAAGITFEPGLVDVMVAEATIGEAQPLLGHLLRRLAEEPDSEVTLARYDTVGRVGGAIAAHADAVYQELTAAYPREAVDRTLLCLVGSDGSHLIRRAVAATILDDVSAAIVAELRQARLVTDQDHGDKYVFAHDAVFRTWSTLTDLIERNLVELRELTLLERRAAAWRDTTIEDDLLRGRALTRAEQAAARLKVGPEVEEFLTASAQLRDRRLSDEADDVVRRALREPGLPRDLVTAAVATAVREIYASPLGRLALWARTARPREERLMIGHQLSPTTIGWLADGRVRTADVDNKICTWTVDGHLADVRWIDGMTTECSLSPDGRYLLLRDGVVWCADDGSRLGGFDGRAFRWVVGNRFAVAEGDGRFAEYAIDNDVLRRTRDVVVPGADYAEWSGDGRLVATRRAGVVEIRDAKDPTSVVRVTDGEVDAAVRWSPDGSRLAVVNPSTPFGDGTVVICDRSGLELVRFDGGRAIAEWSRDGRLLATAWAAGEDTVQVFEAASGQRVFVAIGVQYHIWSLHWTPDSRSLVRLGGELATGWHLATRTEFISIPRHTLCELSWAPDRSTAVACFPEFRAALVSRTEVAEPLEGAVQHVAWSPRGDVIAGAVDLAVIRLWSSSGGVRCDLAAPGVRWLSWSPDGAFLAEAWDLRSKGKAGLRVWRIADRRAVCEFDWFSEEPCLAWSPDSTKIAVGRARRGVVIFRVADGSIEDEWHVDNGWVTALSWAPGGDRLAISCDSTIYVWTPRGAAADVRGSGRVENSCLAWSPDGVLVCAYGLQANVAIWDAARGDQVVLPTPEPALELTWSDGPHATLPGGAVLSWIGPGRATEATWAAPERPLTDTERAYFRLPLPSRQE